MASTFSRINAVIVSGPDFVPDAYLDPAFAAGTYNANLAQPTSTLAGLGLLYRGMPIAMNANGYLVPPNVASTTTYGILTVDVTAYVVARQAKVGVVKQGRVRTYAGASLTAGQWVKTDIASSFGGVIPWVEGTDSIALRLGRVYSQADGSNSGGVPSPAMSQGDTVFLDIRI